MRVECQKFPDDFSSAGSCRVELSPIARAFRGLTDGNRVAHIEVGGVWYSFLTEEIVMNDEGVFCVEADTVRGSQAITLSSEAIDYIIARQSGEGYQEKMAEWGFPDGHYGHRPYECE